MPINGRPLLEYWLSAIEELGITEAFINTHYRANDVESFLNRPHLRGLVKSIYEPMLLGTAGTLRANMNFFAGNPCLVIHADNWCQCNFKDFVDYHFAGRPKDCLITMMTFTADNPMDCGIVKVDQGDRVLAFYEKPKIFIGNRANAAVYIMEPEVLEWISLNSTVTDISTEVLPHFIGKIATWHNNQIHRDIGSYEALKKAQHDFDFKMPGKTIAAMDDWSKNFAEHKIHSYFQSFPKKDFC